MTKEQIKKLIKKIRTRKDYYQMQKSLNTIADVLEEITGKTDNIDNIVTLISTLSNSIKNISNITPFISNATGDDTFTKDVVAKPDGTLGMVDREDKIRTKVLQEDYTPTENLEYLDVFTFNLKANTTYKLELGILGDSMMLSKVIVTDDIGNLSLPHKYLTDITGSSEFFIETEEKAHQRNLFDYGFNFSNNSILLNYIIRPKSDCFIKIPVKRFSSVPTTSKLLAGTYMRLIELV